MKKQFKTEDIVTVFQILKGAKTKDLEASVQIKLVKLLLVFKPAAVAFEENTKDASEKIKESFEGIDEKAAKANEYRDKMRDPKLDASTLPMSVAEYHAFMNGEWKEYNDRIVKALKNCAKKKVELEFEPISSSDVQKLMESNNWTLEYGGVLFEHVVKE